MKDSLVKLLKEMFQEMVVKKDPEKIANYYSRDFLLYTNGETWDYDRFLHSHEEIYRTPIQYKIGYDEEAFFEYGNKLAGRVFITTQKPNEAPKEIEVILIAQYVEGKIYHLWELTYPDWTKLSAFSEIV